MKLPFLLLIASIFFLQHVFTQECNDVQTNCNVFNVYCTSDISAYKQWMELNCRKTCKFCVDTPVTTPPPDDGDCQDKPGVSCGQFNKYGLCSSETYGLVMTNYCKRTCSFCECEDSAQYQDRCGNWAGRGWCENESLAKFMKTNCKKSCAFFPCKKSGPDDTEKTRAKGPSAKVEGYGESKCGKDNVGRGRIVGGVDAKPHRWHWQGGMYVRSFSGSLSFKCGGSLIATDLFMTAAHCVDKGTDKRDVVIRLGDHDRATSESSEQDIKVKRIVINRGWSRKTLRDDIALLHLEEGVELNKEAGTICLPEEDVDPDEKATCYITGWGKTGGFKTAAHGGKLQEAKLPIISNEDCGKRNVDSSGTSRITDNMICAGKSGVSGCQGDSGGPFVCKRKGKWYLEGVVSWGSRVCNTDHRFTVFTRVNKYISWVDRIKKNIRR